MLYRILTKNGVDNTNIDGARNYNFNAGRRSGIVKDALNGGNFFASNNNTIALDTCELRLCGHRIVLDAVEYKTLLNIPSVPIRYSMIAQVIVDDNNDVSFDLIIQSSSTPLVQENLDTTGKGKFQLEIGRFTQLTDGTITDVVRTADLITGGAGGGDSEYIRIGTVTTNKISPELDADVDIENTINPDDNKPQTNFTFNLPTPSGTVVSLNGVEKTSINTDTTPTANSENLITSGGVHDYPAVVFAESERQKSKNLILVVDSSYTNYGYTMTCKDGEFTLNGSSSDEATFSLTGTDGVQSRGKYAQNITITTGNSVKFKAGTYTFSSNYDTAQLGILYGDLGSSTSTGATMLDGITRTLTFNNDTYVVVYRYISPNTYTNYQIGHFQAEEGSVATDYQPYHGQITHNGDAPVVFAESERQKSQTDGAIVHNGDAPVVFAESERQKSQTDGAIVHEKQIEITIGNATLNTDVVSSGEVSWVKQGKLVVVSFSDLKFKGSIAHQNLYFSGLPKKAIKPQTFLLQQMNAFGGSSLRCMIQKDSTEIVNWYQDTTLDTNAQYYGQLTYITDEN